MRHEHQKNTHVVPRPLPESKRFTGLRERPTVAVAIIAEYDSLELSNFICAVVSMGYCVSFTATSDGGAVSITCYDGEHRVKGYGRDTNHLERSIRDLLGVLRGEE